LERENAALDRAGAGISEEIPSDDSSLETQVLDEADCMFYDPPP
jgi:hypothetical protein